MKVKETFLDGLFGNVLEQAEELVIEGEKLIERLKKEDEQLTSVRIFNKIKVMKKYLVVDINDINFCYKVDNLDELTSDMYSCELDDNSFEVVKGWFYKNHKVFVSESEIEEVFN